MSVTLKNSHFEKTSQYSFRHLYGNLALSDVTLVSKDEELFSVHKIVLSYASNKLKTALKNNKPSHILHLDQMSEDIKLILKFIYTGTIDNSSIPKFIQMVNALGIEVPQFEEEEVTPDLKIEGASSESSEEEQDESKLIYDKTDKPRYLNDHKNILKLKIHKCEQCGKIFSQAGHLTTHKRTHTGEKNYKCDQCHKAFSESGVLKKHYRIHTGEKPFKCDQCDKTFFQSGNLTTHKISHTGKKPFKCGKCDKSFSTSSHLTTHKRTHTGEKPFKCDLCDKTFRSGHMKEHKRSHTGEKPFKCDQCNKTFSESGSLKRHNRRGLFTCLKTQIALKAFLL